MSESRTQDHYEIVTSFWQSLRAADELHLRAARRQAVRRRRLRTLALAIIVVLGLAAAAFAIRALVFGSDAPPTFNSSKAAGLGAIKPGTVKLLELTVKDPDGGSRWGMRVFSTRRGYGCYQVGRLVGGELVALGIDGAFGNDGRAHRLPIERHGCGGTDDVGHLRFTALAPVTDASASLAEDRCLDRERARAAKLALHNAERYLGQARRHDDANAIVEGRRQVRAAKRRRDHSHECPPGALRLVVAGAAGPAASSVELRIGRQHAVEKVRARDGGAFLFVLRRPSEPVTTKLTARFADGRSCDLPDPVGAPHRARPKSGCDPPPGFIYRKQKRVR